MQRIISAASFLILMFATAYAQSANIVGLQTLGTVVDRGGDTLTVQTFYYAPTGHKMVDFIIHDTRYPGQTTTTVLDQPDYLAFLHLFGDALEAMRTITPGQYIRIGKVEDLTICANDSGGSLSISFGIINNTGPASIFLMAGTELDDFTTLSSKASDYLIH